MQSGQPWAALLEAVVRWHADAVEAGEGVDNSALAESLHEMMEYSNEFSRLSNASLPPPPVCPEVRCPF